MNNDDFFIGYRPRLSSNTARFAATASGLLLLIALGLAVSLAASQDKPADAAFEYGVLREYKGVIRIDPWPRLELPGGSTMLLVAPFKHGADDTVTPHRGAQVTLSGSLIQRGHLKMLEIDPASIVELVSSGGDPAAGAGSPDPEPHALMSVTVRGEIVDGKCWLGVMKPGSGTVHRACARLCLRGGVPALLHFVDADGRRLTALLTAGDDGRIPDDLLNRVARPIELTGTYDPDAAGGIGVFTVTTTRLYRETFSKY